MLKGVNWIAVIVAVIVLEALGYAWYGPLFGAAWTAALGKEVPSDNTLMALGVANTLIVSPSPGSSSSCAATAATSTCCRPC